QPDGMIVVGGILSSDTGAFLGLARLNPDGGLDATFNPGTALGNVNAHALDNSGNIYVHSFFDYAEQELAKVSSTGRKLWSLPLKPTSSFYEKSAILARQDGSILLGGSFTNVAGAGRKSLAALDSGGKIKDEFNLAINGAV